MKNRFKKNSQYLKHVKWTATHAEKEIENGLELLKKIDRPIITIFGSHTLTKNNKYHKHCEKTAYELGKKGFAIVTGGGPGIMQAANSGASRAKTISVGIRERLLREQKVKSDIYTNKIAFRFLFVRRFILQIKSDAIIFYPGGFGTLNELFEYATLIVTGVNDRIPVILVNKEYWNGLYVWMRGVLLKEGIITKKGLKLMRFADNTEQILEIINRK
ncbi:TPA: TIGR00730 family Rossman fold protein [Candidatus Woesearchaeota archaeon]|nr:TIGR00730 family Rossman fold protein [Candidatus Woesearchaeota archaeon]HIH31130.1 TIGR00730 family Rossman fold protein [Candidatus Woesearchaeota archaeon]HIH54611.1 TIGR00730 family Rossman fold protein [Candidatus Woesearchaeota archaeon]HIJ02335.1 TIGR00730 family Rossman fold protein [Candidatus Woesearchaeota archaeon]HIJ14187.1 TIGR00730 family Rossman fold protein [Candidatus Woesearchaeota archaeon]